MIQVYQCSIYFAGKPQQDFDACISKTFNANNKNMLSLSFRINLACVYAMISKPV